MKGDPQTMNSLILLGGIRITLSDKLPLMYICEK